MFYEFIKFVPASIMYSGMGRYIVKANYNDWNKDDSNTNPTTTSYHMPQINNNDNNNNNIHDKNILLSDDDIELNMFNRYEAAEELAPSLIKKEYPIVDHTKND